MKPENKRIIYEAILVRNAFNNEVAEYGDNAYSIYHVRSADWYRSFSSRFNQILGFTGDTMDEFPNYVSAITLTSEQKKALVELRQEPMFKKLMGETALQHKAELESVLGSKIVSKDMTFADENGATVAAKTELQLLQELAAHSITLDALLDSKSISDEQHDRYTQNLNYIYEYYMSCSKGEQIPFRKMTDDQYERVEQESRKNGISFEEQLSQKNEYLKYDHDRIEELQSQNMRK